MAMSDDEGPCNVFNCLECFAERLVESSREIVREFDANPPPEGSPEEKFYRTLKASLASFDRSRE